MSPELTGAVFTILLFVLMFAGMPIAFTLSFTGFLGLVTIFGIDAALLQLSMVPYSSVADYTFSVIPLFILTGGLALSQGS